MVATAGEGHALGDGVVLVGIGIALFSGYFFLVIC